MRFPFGKPSPGPVLVACLWGGLAASGCAPVATRPVPAEASAVASASAPAAPDAVAGTAANEGAAPATVPAAPTTAPASESVAVAAPTAAGTRVEQSRSATVAAGAPDVAAGTAPQGEGAVATTSADFDIDLDEQPSGFPDPFERMNRRMFAFNRKVDAWVIAPVSRTYGFLMPRPAKVGVRNFLFNIASPVRLVNDVLQGQFSNAGNTAARFAINTVAGLGGFIDTANYVGILPHDADFGQTLAKKGVGSGPFLVVPILGPTTVRDGFGAIVDTAMNPAMYIATPIVSSPLLSVGVGTSASGIVERERHDRDLKRLEEGSTDYYAALRSAYYQNRIAEIGSDGPPLTAAGPPSAPDAAVAPPADGAGKAAADGVPAGASGPAAGAVATP